MKIAPYLAILILVLLLILQWRCDGKATKKAEQQMELYHDENEQLKKNHATVIPVSDSMSRIYKAQLSAARDTIKQLSVLQEDKKASIVISNIRIKNLIDLAHDYAEKIKDTTLKNEVDKFRVLYYNQEAQAKTYYYAGQKKDSVCSAEMTAQQMRLDAKDTTIHLLGHQFDSAQVISHQFENMANRYIKKAGKRFSIGPYIGVTYNGKVMPSYGLSVQYTIFKF